MHILQTKINIPNPASTAINRQRLLDKLSDGLRQRHRLLLVVAPAGFGKTTLVTTWLQTLQTIQPQIRHIAWFSLEEADGDESRFLRYLVAALDESAIPLPTYLIEQLDKSDPPPAEVMLTDLLNGLSGITHSVTLVLEDYHLIKNNKVDEAVTFLLNHAPENFHLVVVSRVEPNFPLSRLRARQQITEVRAQDLRFSTAEALQFFKKGDNQPLTEAQIEQLGKRTEGWAAGLQMANLSLQNQQDVVGSCAFFCVSTRE